MLLRSKDDLKQKCFLIRLTLILAVLFINKDVSGAAMSNEDLTEALKQLEEKFEVDQLVKIKYESTISNLQNELESFKNVSDSNFKLIEDSMNETSIIVGRLDKNSRIGTSCSSIANLGKDLWLQMDGIDPNGPDLI